MHKLTVVVCAGLTVAGLALVGCSSPATPSDATAIDDPSQTPDDTSTDTDTAPADPIILPEGIRTDGIYLGQGLGTGGYFTAAKFNDDGTVCDLGIGWPPAKREDPGFYAEWLAKEPNPCESTVKITPTGSFVWAEGAESQSDYQITSVSPDALQVDIFYHFSGDGFSEVWDFLPAL